MVNVISSAPDPARYCLSLYGLIANWNITIGRFAMGALMLLPK